MYDANELIESLSIYDIQNVLAKLGAEVEFNENDIDKGQLITNTICHNQTGGSHKLYYIEDRKRFHCFTGCESMSVYDLIIKRFALNGIALSFPESIQWLAENTGRAFGGSVASPSIKQNEELRWMNKFKRKKEPTLELQTYSDYILELFSSHGSHRAFTDDNIDSVAMDRFNIRYDWTNNAIIIPHRYHKNGKIVGLTSRNLNESQVQAGYKYIPTQIQGKHYSFPKHLNFYGLWENLENIKHLKKVAIFESEKSVLQCETYFGEENNFAVALGGKYLSSEHMKILIGLGIEEVVLNFDKDFHSHHDEDAKEVIEHIVEIGRKLSPYMRVFTTFDKYGLLDYKDSPSDKGKEILIKLFDEKEEILNAKN